MAPHSDKLTDEDADAVRKMRMGRIALMLQFKRPLFPWHPFRMFVLLGLVYSGSKADSQKQHAISWSSTLAGARSALYKDPCEVAAELRGKVAGILAEGRLDRTIRLIQKANRLCEKSMRVTWSQEVSTLAEVGRYAEARALAKKIDADANADLDAKNAAWKALALCAQGEEAFSEPDQAQAEMRRLSEEATKLQDKPDETSQRLAKKTFLGAWETWHPNARALVSAGLVAKKLGQYADAQRLFDRALVDAEKEYGHSVTLEMPNQLGGMLEVMAWSRDGQLLALYNGQSISIFDRTWRVRLRIQAPTFGLHDTFSVPGEPIVGDWGAERPRALDVTTLLFSPDGKTLVSGGHHNHGLILWDIASGKELRTIPLRPHTIRSIAYSPDGKTLAVGLSDRFVGLWDVASGKLLHTLKGHEKPTSAIAYSPDGKTLASASADKSVRVWDVASGKLLHTLLGHTEQVDLVVFSPDGKTLASGSTDKSVVVWDVVGGKQLQSLAYADSLRSLVYSPNSKMLAIGLFGHPDNPANDKTPLPRHAVQFWDVATGEPRGALNVDSNILSLMYSPNGTMVVALGGKEVSLREEHPWKVLRGTDRQSLVEYKILTNAWRVSPDGEVVVTGALGEPWVVRDAGTGKVLHLFGNRSNSSRALTYSPDGNTLASGMEDNTVQVWDAHKGQLLHTLVGHTGMVRSVAYSRESDKLVSGSSDKTVRLWDVASGKELRRFTGHTKDVSSVAYSPDGRTVASGSTDATVRVWDVATGKERERFSEDLGSIDAIGYAPKGKMLAAASGDSLYVWDIATNEKPLEAFYGGHSVFLPEGTILASCDRLWNVANGEERSVLGSWLGCPVFSPDGKTMAGDGVDNFHVVLRDLRGNDLMQIKTEDCRFRGMGFSPDAGSFACGARDGSILLFDLYDGVLGATLREAGIPGASYVFTPSGHIDIQGPQACAARDKLTCRVGPVFFPIDVCEERLFVADLLTHQQLGGTYFAEPEWINPQMRCEGASGH